MIRINLLSEGRRPVVARKAKSPLSFGDQDPSLIILSAGLVLGLLVAFGWYFSVKTKLDRVGDKVKQAEREVKELEPILKEVEDFKRKKRELSTKIEIITDLTSKRRGPVNVMDRISRALPDLLWLRSMTVRGKTVSLAGEAMNTSAIATFIENLTLVPEFQEPNTKNVRRGRQGSSYSFSLSFRFQDPEPPAPEGEATVEGGAAGEAQAAP
ncbi:MAG: PilN domain-containing protein [Holophagales bacterium]|nr:PilN domain-containing protein [Holophagales bacterium]